MSIAKWWKRCKRRTAGIYLYRTDKPHGRGRHNGYVGKTTCEKARDRQHLVGGPVYGPNGQASTTAKPWSDLNPRKYMLRLPWWLAWSWILSPLEILAIWLLLPAYNDLHNRRNPRRITLSAARNQRAARDGAALAGWSRTDRTTRWIRAYVLRPVYVPIMGVLCVAVGIIGQLATR